MCTSCSDNNVSEQEYGSANGEISHPVIETEGYTVYPVVSLFPLSGNFSDYGKAMEAAARLAENDVNTWLEEKNKEWRLKIETPRYSTLWL